MNFLLYLFIGLAIAKECKKNSMECMGKLLRTCTDDGYWNEMPCPGNTVCSATEESVSCKKGGSDKDDAGVSIDTAMSKDDSDPRSNSRKEGRRSKEKTVTVTRSRKPRAENSNDTSTVTVTKVPKEIDIVVGQNGSFGETSRMFVKMPNQSPEPDKQGTLEYQVSPQSAGTPSATNQGPAGSTPYSPNPSLSGGPNGMPPTSSAQGSPAVGQVPNAPVAPSSPPNASAPASASGGTPASGAPSSGTPSSDSTAGSSPASSGSSAPSSGSSAAPSTGSSASSSGSSGASAAAPSNPSPSAGSSPGSSTPSPSATSSGSSPSSSSATESKSDSKQDASKPGDSQPSSGGGQVITTEQLSKAMKESGFAPKPDYMQAVVKEVNAKYKDKEMAAMLLAQLAHESGGFAHLEEIECKGNGCGGRYNKDGLPGKNYHGRGFIQLTWADNYKAASKDLGMGDKLFQDPDSVAKDTSLAVKVSIWYWDKRVLTTPGVADKKQFGLTTKAINGPLECGKGANPKAEKRYQIYKTIANAMGIKNLAANTGC